MAFGAIALRGLYDQPGDAERREREELVIAASDTRHHRMRADEIYAGPGSMPRSASDGATGRS